MQEKQVTYVTNLLRQAGVVVCPRCLLHIGHLVEGYVDGHVMTMLAVGGALLFRGSGWCYYCKHKWFWCSSKNRNDPCVADREV